MQWSKHKGILLTSDSFRAICAVSPDVISPISNLWLKELQTLPCPLSKIYIL